MKLWQGRTFYHCKNEERTKAGACETETLRSNQAGKAHRWWLWYWWKWLYSCRSALYRWRKGGQEVEESICCNGILWAKKPTRKFMRCKQISWRRSYIDWMKVLSICQSVRFGNSTNKCMLSHHLILNFRCCFSQVLKRSGYYLQGNHHCLSERTLMNHWRHQAAKGNSHVSQGLWVPFFGKKSWGHLEEYVVDACNREIIQRVADANRWREC